jgi:hypothetical protein
VRLGGSDNAGGRPSVCSARAPMPASGGPDAVEEPAAGGGARHGVAGGAVIDVLTTGWLGRSHVAGISRASPASDAVLSLGSCSAPHSLQNFAAGDVGAPHSVQYTVSVIYSPDPPRG